MQRIIKRSQIKATAEASSLSQYSFVSRVLALLFFLPQKSFATFTKMNAVFYFAFQVVLGGTLVCSAIPSLPKIEFLEKRMVYLKSISYL